ncbi:MAG: glutamine synthetase family protein [Candidatus Micrarchaeota archaeon]
MESIEKSDVFERMKKDGVKFVDLEFVDIMGTVKACEITVEKMMEVAEDGLWFDGSSIEGFVRIYESDMFLRPDLSTYSVLPWAGGPVARFICDVYDEKKQPFEGDPRHVLKRALERAKKIGFEYMVGPELEFFLFKRDNGTVETHDKAGYFDLGNLDLASEVRREVVTNLESMGLSIEMSHHEVAPGQHEIDFKYGDALSVAGWVLTYKTAVKSAARKHGLYASFMPKPLFGVNGSGMHVHQSLWKDGQNAFFDETDKYNLSPLAKHFIAGQLKHARALSAIAAPTINSYKRLIPGYEAPVYICWGRINRSALLRIPRYSEGKKSATRCEYRAPDPSSNPYLVFAALLSAGLDGIEQKLEPPEPIEENVYHLSEVELEKRKIPTLPHSLRDAVTELQNDTVLKEALGKHVFEKLAEAQIEDWKDYKRQVTKWEMDRYFDVL